MRARGAKGDENMPEQDTMTDTTTTDASTTDATTIATDTGMHEVVLTQDQYNEIISMSRDSVMAENALLTVLIGFLFGYVAIKGVFDAWRN